MRVSSFVLSLLLVCSATADAATRAVFFNAPSIQPTDRTIWQVRAADVTGDGKIDLAVLSRVQNAYRFLVYPGQGNGDFLAARETALNLGDGAQNLEFDIADLDADGKLDVAVGYQSNAPKDKVQVLYGTGAGTFTSASTLDIAPCRQIAIALADVTSDGKPDILTCGLTVFPNGGNRTFGTAIRTAPDWGGRILAADSNADGRLDVFMIRASTPTLLISNGDGTFKTPVQIEASGPATLADLDRNGRADLIWVDDWKHDLAVRLAGTASGAYPTRISAGFASEMSWNLAVADMNNDGRPDVLVSSLGHVSVWLTQAGGTLAPGRFYATDGTSTAADFDGDGFKDIVTFNSSGVSLLRGGAGGTLQAPEGRVISGVHPTGAHFGGDLIGAAAFDVTNDGKLDAVTTSGFRRSIIVLPGNGDGTTGAMIETPVDIAGSEPAFNVIFADANGDGVKDAIVGDLSVYHCWLARPDGTFQESGEVSTSGISPEYDLMAGDFNGDGHLDLASGYNEPLTVYPGAGDGTFGPGIVTAGASVYSPPATIGDINNDGRDDLLLDYHVLFGTSAGTFTVASRPRFGSSITTLADLNDDGNLDLFLSDDFLDQDVTIELGNGDGTFANRRVMDLDLREAPQFSRGVAGDYDGDGHVDLAFHTTVLLGDGAGSFKGYARLRHRHSPISAAAGDFDGNGTSDLMLVDGATSLVEIVPTCMTGSKEIPITVAITSAPVDITAGGQADVVVTHTTPSVFTPTGAVALITSGEIRALTAFESGSAQAYARTPMPGPTTLTARFLGDDLFAASADASRPLDVTRPFAIMRPTVEPQYPTVAQPVRIRSAVEGALATPPTGTVSILVDGVVKATGAAPEFDLTIPPLTLGYHTVTLHYEGDSLYRPSDVILSIKASKIIPARTLTVSPETQASVNTPVTLTMTFADSAVTGSVRFYAGVLLLGTTTVANSSASFTTSALAPELHFLQAVYAGDDRYTAGSSSISNYSIVDSPNAPSATSLHLITPCRVVDTRDTTVLTGDTTRPIKMTGVCGIPSGAKAVAVNVTAVASPQSGYLTLFPAGTTRPATSTTSYRANRTRATFTIAPLSVGGYLQVYNGGSGARHFLLDVTGYFQ